MKERTFKFDLFIKQLENEETLTEDIVDRYQKISPLLDHFFNACDMEDDLLEQFTIEDFEWFYDVISYWPIWEMDCEREDLNHFGVQKGEIIDFIEEISRLPQVRRKVTFI